MSEDVWRNALDGPRSLGTAPDCAIAAIEDPGIVEIDERAVDAEAFAALAGDLGIEFPRAPWGSASIDDVTVAWVGPGRWWILTTRERASAIHAAVASAELTGGYGALKLVGPAAIEILARLCPLDFSAVPESEGRGTRIAGIRVLVRREPGSVEQLLILVPRSRTETVALALMKVARDAQRLRLFEPATPPPI